MRILVTGSRSFTDSDMIVDALLAELPELPEGQERADATIIHGAARGADQRADRIAHIFGLGRELYPAEWSRYGRKAGPIRNAIMVEQGADVCLAFRVIGVPSPGTDDCVRKALAAGIRVEEYWETPGAQHVRTTDHKEVTDPHDIG